jgi:two-component system, NtrC family, sensor histidine kinase KinB
MFQDQRSVLELLYRVSREFASALDLKTVLTRVLFAAINNVGGERASIVVIDDNEQVVESAIVYGNQLREITTIRLKDTVDRGLAGWVVRNRQPALVPDTSLDSRWLRREDDAQDRSGAKAAIAVPLLSREKMLGVLTIVHSVPKSYGDEHLELMRAIADQAGVAIVNARLFSESQRQARVMTALAESAVNINTSLQMDQVFESILTQTKQALQVETAALGMVENSNNEIVYRAAIGENSAKLIGKRMKTEEGIAGIVVRDGRGVLVPVVNEDARLAEAEQLVGGKTRALSCAPIHAHGKVIGVLEVFNPINKGFDPDALLVLTGLGGLAGSTIQNAQLFESLDIARQRYRDLFEDSIDSIVITDLEGRIVEANRQVSILSGHPADKLHEFLIEQMHDINFEKTGQKFENIGDSAIVYESTLYDSHGGMHPVQVYARKVVFDEAESIQWILRDITERKDLDALREDLAAMIYHDLRSPLANVLSSMEMIAAIIPETEKESSAPILRIATNSIDRIQRLISSLLDLTRLEQNQPIGEQQSVAISTLVNDVMDAVMPSAEGRKQIVEISLADKLPAVFIDMDMIRRVLINLMENAIKYTPFEGKLKLSAETDGEFVRISVQDNGPGIPESDRERIFDKFTRLKNSKNGPSGLGVGLAFCKLAVKGHGGKIWVEPAPEKGARFIFTLPVVKEK